MALAAEEWERARDLWSSIVGRDSQNIIARIELSKSLEGAGKTREALKILDEARVADPSNSEVLFRAAELNLSMSNATAALDNLALIIQTHPNLRAATMARDLAEGLNRFEDALQYHETAEKLGLSGKEAAEAKIRIEFKKLELEGTQDEDKLIELLQKFVKRNSFFVPGLHRLALLEADAGNNEDAAKHLMTASKVSGDPTYWQEAAKIWLKNAQPNKAVAAARAGTNDSKGANKIKSTLEMVKLYLKLNMLEEAKGELDGFEGLLSREEVQADRAISRTVLILRGRLQNALGNYQESAKIWEQLSDSNFKLERKIIKLDSARREMPPARLSTP
jgi:lipopolysaccharide biosynthesis regulator YciM